MSVELQGEPFCRSSLTDSKGQSRACTCRYACPNYLATKCVSEDTEVKGPRRCAADSSMARSHGGLFFRNSLAGACHQQASRSGEAHRHQAKEEVDFLTAAFERGELVYPLLQLVQNVTWPGISVCHMTWGPLLQPLRLRHVSGHSRGFWSTRTRRRGAPGRRIQREIFKVEHLN